MPTSRGKEREFQAAPEPAAAITASRLAQVLEHLSQEPRLIGILGDRPLEGLLVCVRDGALALIPRGTLAAEQSEVVEAVLHEASEALAHDAHAPESPHVSPADPRPHLIATRAHLDAGNPGRALEVAEAALGRWPENVDLHTYRALALAALGRSAEAIEAYQHVIRRDPHRAFAHAAAAELSAKLGRWDQALAYARAALAISPNDAGALLVSAQAQEHLGLYEEAAQALRQALAADPDLPGAREELRRMEQHLQEEVEIDLLGAAGSPVQGEMSVSPGLRQPDVALPHGRDARWATAAPPLTGAPGLQCPECTASNPPRVSFCVNCGARLKT